MAKQTKIKNSWTIKAIPAVEAVVSEIRWALSMHRKVKVEGFGIIELKKMAARQRYDINKKKFVNTKEHYKLVFRPSKEMKSLIWK